MVELYLLTDLDIIGIRDHDLGKVEMNRLFVFQMMVEIIGVDLRL